MVGAQLLVGAGQLHEHHDLAVDLESVLGRGHLAVKAGGPWPIVTSNGGGRSRGRRPGRRTRPPPGRRRRTRRGRAWRRRWFVSCAQPSEGRPRPPGTVEGMDDLYREQILEHYKRPHNFGRLSAPTSNSRTPTRSAATSSTCHPARRRRTHRGGRLRGQGLRDLDRGDVAAHRRAGGQDARGGAALPKEFVLDLLGIDISATRMKCALLGLKVVKARASASPPTGRTRASRATPPRPPRSRFGYPRRSPGT